MHWATTGGGVNVRNCSMVVYCCYVLSFVFQVKQMSARELMLQGVLVLILMSLINVGAWVACMFARYVANKKRLRMMLLP